VQIIPDTRNQQGLSPRTRRNRDVFDEYDIQKRSISAHAEAPLPHNPMKPTPKPAHPIHQESLIFKERQPPTSTRV